MTVLISINIGNITHNLKKKTVREKNVLSYDAYLVVLMLNITICLKNSQQTKAPLDTLKSPLDHISVNSLYLIRIYKGTVSDTTCQLRKKQRGQQTFLVFLIDFLYNTPIPIASSP